MDSAVEGLRERASSEGCEVFSMSRKASGWEGREEALMVVGDMVAADRGEKGVGRREGGRRRRRR